VHRNDADLQAVKHYAEGGVTDECSRLLTDGLALPSKDDEEEIEERLIEKVNELAGATRKGSVCVFFPLSAEFLGSFSVTGNEGGFSGAGRTAR
jgi:hypothetical protein